MSVPRVLILHGWQGNSLEHWQTWLARRLRRAGAEVLYPELPDAMAPRADRWGPALHEQLAALAALPGDGDRVVACHSLACVAWMREAPRIDREHRVDRAALVAPACPLPDFPEIDGFFPVDLDERAVRAAAAQTRVVCADDDPYCPAGAAEQWARPLRLPVDLLSGQGHLNAEAGYGPWPAMLAWCLGERADLAPADGSAA